MWGNEIRVRILNQSIIIYAQYTLFSIMVDQLWPVSELSSSGKALATVTRTPNSRPSQKLRNKITTELGQLAIGQSLSRVTVLLEIILASSFKFVTTGPRSRR
jgi:hypothetical protein